MAGVAHPILAALFNALFLLLAVSAIARKQPGACSIQTGGPAAVMIVAGIGIP